MFTIKPGGSVTTKKPVYKNVHWKPLDDPNKFREATGPNSPETKADSTELKDAKAQIEELKKDLAQAKEDHQYDNLVHKKELEKMNK
ncbi:MAG: hypothetical protein QF858_01900 [Candidatus Pacebacteria bacterium]|nr:hypothetical protein [Candidatus Paceibacterota bacterium]